MTGLCCCFLSGTLSAQHQLTPAQISDSLKIGRRVVDSVLFLVKQSAADIGGILKDHTLPSGERQQRAAAVSQARDKKISTLLTPEQITRFKALLGADRLRKARQRL